MMGSLLAYDAEGKVIGTLDLLASRDERGAEVRGPNGESARFVDFLAMEAAGESLRDLWYVTGSAGIGAWPEWLGAAAHAFRVELDDGRIVALIHGTSGYRRDRAQIERAMREAPVNDQGARDLRSIVGGPDRPVPLDDEGRNVNPVRQRPPLPDFGDG